MMRGQPPQYFFLQPPWFKLTLHAAKLNVQARRGGGAACVIMWCVFVISLIQTHLGCLPLQDFALLQDVNVIMRAAARISHCKPHNQSDPKVIREEPRRSPHWFQWDDQNSPPKLPLSFYDHHPSNTPIPRPTPLTVPNGIRIQSVVLPQYTFRTYQPTDWLTDGIDDSSIP